MSENLRWEEIHARTGDNLAASREILKDAGTITRWSRTMLENMQQQQKARQQEREVRQEEREARQQERETQALPLETVSAESPDAGRRPGDFVLVVCLALDLDLMRSPQLLRLFESLAAGQGGMGAAHLEDRYLLLGGRHPVVVDLRAVKMVDGAGLSCLISGHRMLAAAGMRLAVLLAPVSQPARVFGMTNMKTIIPAFGSLDEL